LSALDEVLIRMRLTALNQNRITMSFEYWRKTDGNEDLVARGEQRVVCMMKEGKRLEPAPIPRSLREALEAYAE
jgi:enediyne biosynthesis thioesterase